jgi:hypothetical protein
MGSFVGDENNLAVFRFAVDPFPKFEQVLAVSEIDVKQHTGLCLRGVNVFDIKKRQIKNAVELPADGFLRARRIAKNAKLVHHGWAQTYSRQLNKIVAA